jgi:hypothetical protein
MFAPQFNLFNLLSLNGGNGTEGFIINGVASDDNLRISVNTAGDINAG